jgi:DNA-binding IclR family transcriptional regulator
MNTAVKQNIYYVAVLGKALEILDVFTASDKPSLTLQEVSQLSRFSKNTVFRVLYTLGEHGYIVKRGHHYELGPRATDLGNARLRRRDLISVAGPELDALRDQFGETVNLGVLDGAQIRYVDVRESPHRFRLAERVGGSDFLHCTALGKATLAYLPGDEVRRLLKEQGMPRQTERTFTSVPAFLAELETVRAQGFAVDDQESMEGAYCVAVAVLHTNGEPVAAISISGPTTRFHAASAAKASQALQEAAARIRAGMGYA